MRPLLADAIRIIICSGMLGTRKAVEFIQFDVGGSNLGDDGLIRGLRLGGGALYPALHAGRMNILDPSDGLRAQPFERLMDGTLDFLLPSLEIIEGGAVTVAESFPTLPTAEDKDGLAVPQGIAAVIG